MNGLFSGHYFFSVELKTGKFVPGYAGKMNFYLSVLDDQVKSEADNPSVGLILCRDKNKIVAEYALKDMTKPIGVSEYRLFDDVPKELLDKAIEVIYLKCMGAKISYEGIQRIERYIVPEATLLNAVCHKQYESCIPVQVSVYDDRLYVANVGVLPETWTVTNLLGKHESKPYNPNVATVMYYAGFIESWGRGIEKIRSVCAQDGLLDPEYTVHPGDIMIKFPAPEDRIVRINGNSHDTERDHPEDKEKKILKLLSSDPSLTVTQLSEKAWLQPKDGRSLSEKTERET